MTPKKDNPDYFEASEKDHKFGIETMEKTPELIKKYNIKANPIEVVGGLDSIQKGFDLMKVRFASYSSRLPAFLHSKDLAAWM